MARGRLLLGSGVRDTFGDEPTQRDLNYWFYDAESRPVPDHLLQQQRSVLGGGQPLRGPCGGRQAHLRGPARFQYELDDDGDIKVAPDGTITVSWSLRDEAGEWQPWMTNTFRAGDDGAR
jgi:hypothetical protein